MDPLTDEESLAILERARRGDEAAWAELMSTHREKLVRVASLRFDRRLAARLDPEDLVQEAFAEAHESLDNFFRDREVVSFEHWLRQRLCSRIARVRREHLIVQKRSVEKEQRTGGGGDSGWNHLSDLIDGGTRPSHHLTRQEAQRLVREALTLLNHTDREVLTLFFFEGYSHSEVGRILDIDTKAVSARLLRATKHLASAMKKAHPDWCHDAHPREYRSV